MSLLDIVVEILAPFVICFSVFPIVERFAWFKQFNCAEKVLATFLISITVILLPLFITGIVIGDFFVEVSRSLFILGSLLLIFKVISFIEQNFRSLIPKFVKAFKMRFSLLNFALIVTIVLFVLKYTYFLLIKAMIDWDVVAQYLPISRLMYTQNSFPLTYLGLHNIQQQGLSALYGFIYSNSSSLLSENFRLLPIFFIIISLVLVYGIAKLFVDSKIAKLAIIIYCLLPVFDSSLIWFSFYPDFLFAILSAAIFYLLFKYIKTNNLIFGMFAGLAFGLSSWFKPQSFWLFPVILLSILPLMKNRSLRILIAIIAPFIILFGALPLSFLGGSSRVLLSTLTSTFESNRLFFFLSLVLLISLIVIYNEKGAKSLAISKRSFFKTLIVLFGVALPFFLIWYLRNYFTFGTFLWNASINDPNYQWALTILPPTITGNPPGEFYLANLLFPLILPYFATAFLFPKILGLIGLIRKNSETAMFYTWPISYFLIYFLFVNDVINERYLLPIAPFIAIFSAIGIYYIVTKLKKSPNIEIMVLLSLFFGLFSIAQSRVLSEFTNSYLDSVSNYFLRIIDLVNVPRSILNGSGLSISSLGSQLLGLLFFGIVISFIGLSLLIFIVVSDTTLDLKILKQKLKIPFKKFAHFSLVLVMLSFTLIIPYFAITYNSTKGNIGTFANYERETYGFGNLYSNILPFLAENCSKNDTVLSINTIATGLQYYLKDIEIIDIYRAENLASMRNIVESSNSTEVFLSLKSMNIRYFLIPSNALSLMPSLTGFINLALMSEHVDVPSMSIPKYRLFFKEVVSGNWELFELQTANVTKGIGPQVTVIQNHNSQSQITHYFYYNPDNATYYSTFFGHDTYNITNFSSYFSFEAITPSPHSMALDANQWINFSGSPDVNYTVFWSNINLAYQSIVWKDDSFLNSWKTIGSVNFTTTGDIATIVSSNESWVGIQKEINSINIQDFQFFVVRISQIQGKIIFSGIVNGGEKYLGNNQWISSPGIYVFDVSTLGTNLTKILIYLNSNSTVAIDYMMFAKAKS
jgi:hypothetical protein